jgi:mannose-1-phosphate guanylyltransferase/mannose-6-phosphate isomerase
MVICNDQHRFIIAEQAQAVHVGLSAILLEPAARNTAPAIALAALKACEQGEDPLLLVLPSDHIFADPGAFRAAVRQAAEVAKSGYLATFGIVPDSPETGYGYIQAGEALPHLDGQQVQRFVEKPNHEAAQRYLDAGGYYWNSGMFLFRASLYLEELNPRQPAMVAACTKALAAARNDLDFCRIDPDAFAVCPSESIDYAVMEKTERAAVIPLDAGWNDVGAWPSVWQAVDRDADGNACYGDVLLQEARNNYVYAKNRLVCLLGVEELTVIETPDVILVTHHDRAQDVKNLVDHLKRNNRTEATLHRQVYRPWGAYDSIDEGHRFKVKRITVKPGEKLSLQMHHHRAEHWVVVSGTAKVHMGEEETLVTENESVYIPIGRRHSLENPGKVPLELIEVQTGHYLAEDDIVRFEDRYGRI